MVTFNVNMKLSDGYIAPAVIDLQNTVAVTRQEIVTVLDKSGQFT